MTLPEALGIDPKQPEAELARRLVGADRDLLDDLVKVRIANSRSQTDVAELMGVSPSAVSRIESGVRDPHLSTLRRYAFAVGADVSHVVSRFDQDHWSERCASLPATVTTWEQVWADTVDVPARVRKVSR